MKKLIIIGTGETADIAYEYFTKDSDYEVKAFSVEASFITEQFYLGQPVVDLEELDKKYSIEEYEVFVALSSGKLNRNRTRLFEIVKNKGYKCANYVSSRAFIWDNVKIGENVFIFENNVVQHKAEIGNNVILWSGNHIGHQTKIKDNCFISSHCVISGFCEIGENSFLGVNCTFADNIKIGKDCFIGAGALINKDLEENSLVAVSGTEVSKVGAKRLMKVRD
jgi:sugar O-acyltransferase, sialic acid O-acetyltransferase NeuD family